MNTDQKRAYAATFPVHVGVDTAKVFHKLVVRGPDGQRTNAYKVLVSRAGFEAAAAHLRDSYPRIATQQVLIGLEFAGHHGFTFAHFLAARGYVVVNVLAADTKASKEIEDNNPRKDDAKDAAQVCKLVGDGKPAPRSTTFRCLRNGGAYRSTKTRVLKDARSRRAGPSGHGQHHRSTPLTPPAPPPPPQCKLLGHPPLANGQPGLDRSAERPPVYAQMPSRLSFRAALSRASAPHRKAIGRAQVPIHQHYVHEAGRKPMRARRSRPTRSRPSSDDSSPRAPAALLHPPPQRPR